MYTYYYTVAGDHMRFYFVILSFVLFRAHGIVFRAHEIVFRGSEIKQMKK